MTNFQLRTSQTPENNTLSHGQLFICTILPLARTPVTCALPAGPNLGHVVPPREVPPQVSNFFTRGNRFLDTTHSRPRCHLLLLLLQVLAGVLRRFAFFHIALETFFHNTHNLDEGTAQWPPETLHPKNSRTLPKAATRNANRSSARKKNSD